MFLGPTHQKWSSGLFLYHRPFAMILMHLKFENLRTRICVLILNHKRDSYRPGQPHALVSLVIYSQKQTELQNICCHIGAV